MFSKIKARPAMNGLLETSESFIKDLKQLFFVGRGCHLHPRR